MLNSVYNDILACQNEADKVEIKVWLGEPTHTYIQIKVFASKCCY